MALEETTGKRGDVDLAGRDLDALQHDVRRSISHRSIYPAFLILNLNLFPYFSLSQSIYPCPYPYPCFLND